MTRTALPPELEGGVVAVLRARGADAYARVCEVLAETGVTALELTLTTPGTIEELPALTRALPRACFGVGTVLDAESARASIAAGAHFLVTPATLPDVVAVGVESGIPVVTGAMTPTEILTAWTEGSSAVKVFPAATVGVDYLRQLRGPFPDIPVMPSGGVELDMVETWVSAGAAAVSLGGPLIGDALAGGDLDALRDRARRAVQAARR